MKSGITIEQLSEEVLRQRNAKADYIVNTSQIEIESYNNNIFMHIINDNIDIIEPLNIKPFVHRQIGTHLKIPASYYDRMMYENSDLLATNANSWFKKNPCHRMVRTLDGNARAFLSDRYRRIDNIEILQAVLPIIGQIENARFESCELTDNRLYIKVVNPNLQSDIDVGDIVQAGVVISNSEIGNGSVCVQPLVFRLVCQNGMIVNDTQLRKNHVGRINISDENRLLYSDDTLKAEDITFLMKIQDTVQAAVDEVRFHQVVNLMREAKNVHMNTDNIPGIVKLASSEYKLTENEGDGVLNHLIESREFSLFGLANAVTRYSQDIDSYDRATVLESTGYSIMTMNHQQWNNLNRLEESVQQAA